MTKRLCFLAKSFLFLKIRPSGYEHEGRIIRGDVATASGGRKRERKEAQRSAVANGSAATTGTARGQANEVCAIMVQGLGFSM